jgi:hypothetical protein
MARRPIDAAGVGWIDRHHREGETMSDCTENGCDQAGRWEVGERRYCSTHGIQASIRGSAAMRLVCPVVDPEPASVVSVWDELQAELEAVDFDSPTDREQLLREIAWAAIENGRASA